MPVSGGTRSLEGKRGGVRGYTPWQGKCAQYVTKGGQRVPCDRPCKGYYCEKHGAVGALLALRIWKRTVAREWSETVWRELADLEYGSLPFGTEH